MVPMRPIAESRRRGSNSSSTIDFSLPRSPRNASRVRGSRPPSSPKLARSTCSRAAAACSFACAALGREAVELRAHRVHVQGDPDALERGQADPQRALHEDGVVVHRLGDEPRGEGAVREGQAVDIDAVTGHAHGGLGARETDDAGFHGANVGAPCAT
jgi:hypothetical protein